MNIVGESYIYTRDIKGEDFMLARMGQTDTVQVHRLLTEDSVYDRIRDILKDKRQLFDEFARDSLYREAGSRRS